MMQDLVLLVISMCVIFQTLFTHATCDKIFNNSGEIVRKSFGSVCGVEFLKHWYWGNDCLKSLE